MKNRQSLSLMVILTVVMGISVANLSLNSQVACSEGATPKAGPPRVVQVYPSQDMKYVPVDSGIHIMFSEPVDRSTVVQSVTVVPSLNLIYPDSWQFLNNDSVVVLIPAKPLQYGTTYTIMLKRGVRDKDGEEMVSDYTWTFTTQSKPAARGDVPVNGDFEDRSLLGSWKAGSTSDPGAPEPKFSIVPGDKGLALTISRVPHPSLAAAWVEQALDMDVPSYGLVFLSLDVKLGDYTRHIYTDKEIYPARVVLGYLDRLGKEHVFARAYYYHLPTQGGLNSYAEFQELNTWTTWRYNLSILNPRPARLKFIRLESAGFGWDSSFDNVRIVF
ncbi:MAG TPA: Ig-like domain-containing protein [Firmicutes bacterium]|nr:Ig-like domain-containing protein [Bacillota bacterium]